MRRVLRILASLMVLALFATACGGDDEPAETTMAATTMAPETTMAPAGDREITVSYMQSGTYDSAARALEPTFEADTGVAVEIVAQPFEVLTQTYITDLATGTGQFDLISATSWIADQMGHLLPIGDYPLEEDFPGFISELLEPGRAGYNEDGQLVGIPYAVDAYGLFYRTDLFEAAGVSAHWHTWDEFYAALDAVAPTLPDDVSPLVFAYGATEQTPAIWVAAYDGFLIDSAGRFGVDDAKAIAALEVLQKSVEYAPADALSLSIDEANAVFNDGKAAVLIGWPSFNRSAANESPEVGGKWALGSLPGPGFPWLSLWNASIAASSDDPEATYEWIKAYINPEYSTANMVEYGIGSPFLSTYTDEELLMEHGHDFPTQAENLAKAQNLPWNFDAFTIAFRAVGEMLIGNLSPADVVAEWEQLWAPIDPPPAAVADAAALGMVEGG